VCSLGPLSTCSHSSTLFLWLCWAAAFASVESPDTWLLCLASLTWWRVQGCIPAKANVPVGPHHTLVCPHHTLCVHSLFRGHVVISACGAVTSTAAVNIRAQARTRVFSPMAPPWEGGCCVGQSLRAWPLLGQPAGSHWCRLQPFFPFPFTQIVFIFVSSDWKNVLRLLEIIPDTKSAGPAHQRPFPRALWQLVTPATIS